MRERAVAKRYAQALLAAADRRGVAEAVAESYRGVTAILADQPRLVSLLRAPQVSRERKQELLAKVFGGRVEDLLLHFFDLLLEKDRLALLDTIQQEYQALVEEQQGLARAEVTTAVPLPGDLADALRERLQQITGKTVILTDRVDPAVIGGVCVKMGDRVIDGTIRTNLARLRARLAETDVR